MINYDMKIYKIKNKKSDSYSTGGKYPLWTRNGKTWLSESALKRHLKIVTPNFYSNSDNIVIEEYLVFKNRELSLKNYLKEKQFFCE